MTKHQKETNQWVIIGPDEALESMKEDDNIKTICQLPHPKSNIISLFLLNNNKLYEFIKYSSKYHSWLIKDSVLSGGSLHILTPIDPLFLCLPYLVMASKQDKYMLLDNILEDRLHPSARCLEQCLTHTNLINVCTFKGSDDYIAYKLDNEKLMKWLGLKIANLLDRIQNSSTITMPGQSTIFQHRSTKDKADCISLAWQMVADYLSNDIAEQIRINMQIPGLAEIKRKIQDQENQPPSKKQKLSTSTAEGATESVIEDYRDDKTKTDIDKKGKPAVKKTISQKKAASINTKGMKSMGSFFKSTPKK